MKKILALVLIFLMLFSFAGCGEKKVDKGRILFNVDLEKYMDALTYKGVKVNTKTDEFKENYDQTLSQDVSENNFYTKITSGKVKEGDTVNIDYEGKKDGVAFEGGTAQGYNLTIGSNSFIDGFEDGLIGVEVGSTVDLKLTFPKDYQSAELAGQFVVFTVKVNYIVTEEGLTPEEYYSELGFESVEDYYADVKERAVKSYLLKYLFENSKVKKYPKTDLEQIYKTLKVQSEQNLMANYQVDFQTYLDNMGQTESQYKEDLIEEQIKPLFDNLMPLYYVLDKENLTVTEKDVDAKINEMIKQMSSLSATKKDIEDYYGRYYIEALTVNDKVLDVMYKNAKIS